MERIEFDLLFRWFVGLGVDDPVWDASSFTKNRDRLLAGEIAHRFLAEILAMARCGCSVERALLGGRHAAGGVGEPEELPPQGRLGRAAEAGAQR